MSSLTPSSTAGPAATTEVMAGRTALTMLRRPQVIGIAVLQALMFLLMFRYVIGGAIELPGATYVDYVVPGLVVAGLLFTGGGSAVAVAEEAAGGLYDRLRSLPVAGSAVLGGRAVADAALMVAIGTITLLAGITVGFRVHGGAAGSVGALALLAVYSLAFAWVYVWIGLVASSPQAAQGLGILSIPFSFLSSAFVPVDTLPAVLRLVADIQPLTMMVNACRGLLLGDPFVGTLDHGLGYYIVGSLLWSLALTAVAIPLALRAYRRD
ncbi:ABC transporter permease [Jannaschia sp. R86511]|uniref:ABC transporter permease n=1 Tax=Jannaschia sp. R86511 TaxID=3093853 RepID=UPI0036D2FC1F